MKMYSVQNGDIIDLRTGMLTKLPLPPNTLVRIFNQYEMLRKRIKALRWLMLFQTCVILYLVYRLHSGH